jgi:N-glycosylase/DNA lyase
MPVWSDWRPLSLRFPLGGRVLEETLDGGQSFRWRLDETRVWHGCWDRHAARIRPDAAGGLLWSAPSGTSAQALSRYFDAEWDLAALADALPWRSDPHLARCMAEFPGLRILRQPFGETLLCFLCSSAKRIVQIRQMVEFLAARHGEPFEFDGEAQRRLPTWERLAEVSEADLRGCRLGFRARHVRQTAIFLAGHPGWLEETEALPYAEARNRLCALPGVGEKIADCALLYGAGRLEAFPVDTWILKAMTVRYGLKGWRLDQIAHFGRTHFGPHAGLAQQYLFAWERLKKV